MLNTTLKKWIRNALNYLHLDLTPNLRYDRLTKAILKRVLRPDSNTIDVGCHRGEILTQILHLAPNGKHFAFEPLPDYYLYLKSRFKGKALIFPYAIADYQGITTFQYVKNAPAYSGLQPRKYAVAKPDVEKISVDVNTLDNCLPTDVKIDLIKIDTEGGEFGVLMGAQSLIRKSKPVIIFESGLGASEFYKTKPDKLFDFIETQLYLKLFLLQDFLDNKAPLNKIEFLSIYAENREFYYVATP